MPLLTAIRSLQPYSCKHPANTHETDLTYCSTKQNLCPIAAPKRQRKHRYFHTAFVVILSLYLHPYRAIALRNFPSAKWTKGVPYCNTESGVQTGGCQNTILSKRLRLQGRTDCGSGQASPAASFRRCRCDGRAHIAFPTVCFCRSRAGGHQRAA